MKERPKEKKDWRPKDGKVSFTQTVSARFDAWFRAERKRRGMRSSGLADELAQNYVLAHQGNATDWPEEP